jgi:hypothetical protein
MPLNNAAHVAPRLNAVVALVLPLVSSPHLGPEKWVVTAIGR